jgi:hypothetical protein
MAGTTETVQEAFDRRTAEYRRLVDTPLADGWLQICMDAGFPGLPDGMSLEEAHRRTRAIVNAVLPLHEQAVRERIATALKQISSERKTAAYECADERYHPLMGESGAYWNAARLIREGKEQEGDDD